MDLRGGLLFAGTGGQSRAALEPDRNNGQPRAGLAYRALTSRPLVFRAGFGRYFPPAVEFGGTLGFSQATSALTGTPDLKPFHTLADPFPNGLIQPAGASRGLATQMGDSVSFSDPARRTPNVWQFSAGFQYEFWTGLLAEASCAGSRTRQIQVNRALNFLTVEQLALGTPYLSASVPNPFYGVLSANTSRGAQPNIQRRNLLLPYPHFTSVTSNYSTLGSSWYDSLQVKLEQRLRAGLTLLASYTVSKTMEAAAFKNSLDKELARELVAFDVPQRLVVSGVYEFPIGPKKRWISGGLVSHLIGGWQLGWSAVLQSGMPMSYPDHYIQGNPKLTTGQSLRRWFDTSRSIWVQRPADTLRSAPLRSPNIRRHTAPQLDATLVRTFRLREGPRFQFKASAFNLSNTPIFDFPNTDPNSPLFGVVPATQLNSPRSVELGLRYAF